MDRNCARTPRPQTASARDQLRMVAERASHPGARHLTSVWSQIVSVCADPKCEKLVVATTESIFELELSHVSQGSGFRVQFRIQGSGCGSGLELHDSVNFMLLSFRVSAG